MKIIKKFFLGAAVLFLIIILPIILFSYLPRSNKTVYGVSFDPDYARFLGLDAKEVFNEILDKWNFKYIRLSANWDKVEVARGHFDFTDLDYFIGEAAKKGAKVILAEGQKTPRWPECHLPGWTRNLNESDYRAALLNYIRQTTEHFKNSPALEIWQVENEPFLPFNSGCATLKPESFNSEIALVKSLDSSRPTLVSDSGELSLWFRTARATDLFGTTLYRVVWNKFLGYWNYDWLPSGFYRLKLWLNRRGPSTAFVMELQAEPWLPNGSIFNTPISEQNKSMDLNRLKKNISFAKELGLPRAYLWGAEWWSWLNKQGDADIPNYIKSLKKQ